MRLSHSISNLLCASALLVLVGCNKQEPAASAPRQDSTSDQQTSGTSTNANRIGGAIYSQRTESNGNGAQMMTGDPGNLPKKRLLILATIAPMYCFTRNIVGDLADVELIVPNGARARSFAPTEAQVKRIAQADIIIENGFGFESWMDQLVRDGMKPGAIRVIASRGAGPAIPGLPGDPDTPPGDGSADPSKPPDPHVWLDPLMAIKEVQNIRDALMARDPDHADEYLANENHYESELRDLDTDLGQATVDIKLRRLYCTEPAFTYFLSRYEFTEAAGVDAADGILAPIGTDLESLHHTGLRSALLDEMEDGPPAEDYYVQRARENAQAMRQGLTQ